MSKRIEIVEAENGHIVTVWNQEEGEMYEEPEKYVATDSDEVLELVKKNL